MRRTFVSIIVCCLFVGVLFLDLLSNSAGPTTGLSGAPGESTCILCHNTYTLNSGTANLEIESNIPAEGWTPGETYTITAKIAEPGINRFGFQLFPYGEQSGMEAGTIIVTDTSRSQTFEGANGFYLSHTLGGIDNPDSNKWSFDWVAPMEGTDTISFYASFVAADVADGNKGDYVYTFRQSFAEKKASVIKLWLEGFFNDQTGDMISDLPTKSLLPQNQPFNTAPFNYAGTESFTDTADQRFVDWVLLEARNPADRDDIIFQQAALVDTNGTVHAASGGTAIDFSGIPPGDYHLAVFHKGHLGILSNSTFFLGLGDLIEYDFTSSVGQAFGTGQLKAAGSDFLVPAGDFDGNGIVNNQDFNLWKLNSATLDQYLNVDVDGNGVVNNLDFNFWKANASKIGVISH